MKGFNGTEPEQTRSNGATFLPFPVGQDGSVRRQTGRTKRWGWGGIVDILSSYSQRGTQSFHESNQKKNSPQPVGTCRAAQMRRRQLTGRGWGGPGAAPGHSPHREGSPGVRRVNRSGVSRGNPPGPLEARPGQTPRGKGVP